MLYADGVSPAKSLKKKCWPVVFGLVELPRTLRDSFKNKIISGVFIGNQKPSSNVIFESLIEQIEKLNKSGGNVLNWKNEDITIKIGFYGYIGDGILIN